MQIRPGAISELRGEEVDEERPDLGRRRGRRVLRVELHELLLVALQLRQACREREKGMIILPIIP